jgi:ABC-type amino acid transport substrate-binding protein
MVGAMTQGRSLRVGSAFPDPPFNGTAASPAGLDIDLLRTLATDIGREAVFVPYEGDDFDGIFERLGYDVDCVASGTTVTPARERVAAFCPPYLVSGQSLAVDVARHPDVHGVDDLVGLVIGVQAGNTSEPIARRLVSEGKAAGVKVYAYDRIQEALADVASGRCDAVMKLAPVLTELVKPFDGIEVVARGLSVERIAIATRPGDPLGAELAAAQERREQDGTLARLRRAWLGADARDQS